MDLFSEDIETVRVEPDSEYTAKFNIVTLPHTLSFNLSFDGCLKLARDLLSQAARMCEDDDVLLDAWGIIDERLRE